MAKLLLSISRRTQTFSNSSELCLWESFCLNCVFESHVCKFALPCEQGVNFFASFLTGVQSIDTSMSGRILWTGSVTESECNHSLGLNSSPQVNFLSMGSESVEIMDDALHRPADSMHSFLLPILSRRQCLWPSQKATTYSVSYPGPHDFQNSLLRFRNETHTHMQIWQNSLPMRSCEMHTSICTGRIDEWENSAQFICW